MCVSVSMYRECTCCENRALTGKHSNMKCGTDAMTQQRQQLIQVTNTQGYGRFFQVALKPKKKKKVLCVFVHFSTATNLTQGLLCNTASVVRLLMSVNLPTHLSCHRKRGSAVLGLTTGGRCCHYTPHGRSGLLSRPLSPWHSEPEGTDHWRLRDDTTGKQVSKDEDASGGREGKRDRHRAKRSETDGTFLLA